MHNIFTIVALVIIKCIVTSAATLMPQLPSPSLSSTAHSLWPTPPPPHSKFVQLLCCNLNFCENYFHNYCNNVIRDDIHPHNSIANESNNSVQATIAQHSQQQQQQQRQREQHNANDNDEFLRGPNNAYEMLGKTQELLATEMTTDSTTDFNGIHKIEMNSNSNSKKKSNSNGRGASRRPKRFLIHNNGGILKLVLGVTQPVRFDVPNPVQQLNQLWNLQAQFRPPMEAIDIRKLFSSIFWDTMEKKKRSTSDDDDDWSRVFVYEMMEYALTQMGYDGKSCLLRTICDIAREPIHGTSLFEEVLNAILSPSDQSKPNDYVEAKSAGLQWADCASCYHKCEGFDFLHKYSVFI